MQTRLNTLQQCAAATYLILAATFIVLPTQSIQTGLALIGYKPHYFSLILFGEICLATLVTLLWWAKRKPRSVEAPASRPSSWLSHLSGTPRKVVITLQVLVCSWLIVRTTYFVFYGPLDSDETYISAPLSKHQAATVINPLLTTRNHALSTLLSYFSTKIFGVSEIAVRLPNIILVVLLMALLFQLLYRYSTHPGTWLLINFNLIFNQLFLWFLHSMRGYLLMMIFSLALTNWVQKVFYSSEVLKKSNLLYYLLIGIALTLSHTFGGFYWIGLSLSWFLFWKVMPGPFSAQQIENFKRLFFSSLLLLPWIAVLFVFQAAAINKIGYLNQGSLPQIHFEVLRFFGIPHIHFIYLFLILFTLWIFFFLRENIAKDLVLTWVLSTLVFTIGIAYSLKVVQLEARMFLGLLIPSLFVLGEKLFSGTIKYSLKIAFILLLGLVPFFGREELFNLNPEIHRDFKRFALQVRPILKSAPGPVCVTFQATPWKEVWARDLYFHPWLQSEPPFPCKSYFHLFLSSHYTPKLELQTPEEGFLEEIVSDRDYNYLYKVRSFQSESKTIAGEPK